MRSLGLPESSKVDCLSLRYQIAQKLHACTEQPDDKDNERAHDLVDLQLLMGLLDPDNLQAVREACEEIFASRDRQVWPPALQTPLPWAGLYGAARADVLDADALNLAPTIKDAVVVVQELINAIATA